MLVDVVRLVQALSIGCPNADSRHVWLNQGCILCRLLFVLSLFTVGISSSHVDCLLAQLDCPLSEMTVVRLL